MDETDCPNIDEYGNHLGFCNSCGEETELHGSTCCDDGEIVPYDEEQCEV